LRAAARARRRIVLVSAPEAGLYAGGGWFRELIAAAREAVPDAEFSALLDCGDRPGAALAAIRAEVPGVVFTGRPDVAKRLTDIARQHGVAFATERPSPTLDLGADFFAAAEAVERRCLEILGVERPDQRCP
jgi:acyl-CoA reductase-like NAD-dependent aldehyde dehydrogenase